jgi:hypothetical protein
VECAQARRPETPYLAQDPPGGPERDLAHHQAPGSDHLATMERLSPLKPRREQDALRQAAGPAPHREGIRSSGRRVPDPRGHDERQHCARHPRHRGRGMILPDESARGKGKSDRYAICATEPRDGELLERWGLILPQDSDRRYFFSCLFMPVKRGCWRPSLR